METGASWDSSTSKRISLIRNPLSCTLTSFPLTYGLLKTSIVATDGYLSMFHVD